MPTAPVALVAPTPWLLRRVPALDSLRTYSLHSLRHDVLAGLSVAAVAVPQAMAYALIAGLPVEYGLYTAIVMTAVGAVLDSSKQLINGPTNVISIALLSMIGGIDDPAARVDAAILLAFLIGSIQLGITLLRLGDLTRYISHSVVIGFTLGASALLVLDQVKNLLGLKAGGNTHDHFLVRFWLTLTDGGAPHGPTVAIGVGSMIAVLALRWGKRRIGWTLFPEFLVVVAGAAAVVASLGLDEAGVKVVGAIPGSLPTFRLPNLEFAQIREYAGGAGAIALLGLLEAISMAKSIAAHTRQKLDMNQQCLSEALANLVGSFFQCFPGSGSLTRSAINQQAGAVTQWSGVVSAIAVAAIMLVFAPWARYIPRSALAGLLMVTATGMVEWKALATSIRATRFDAIIVLATALAAVFIDVEFCVIIGVLASFILAVPRAGEMHLTEFVIVEDGTLHERLADDPPCPRLLIFGLEGEMFFGSSTSLERHLDAIAQRVTDETDVVVLRVKRARNADAVGLHLLETWAVGLRARGVHVLLCGVRPEMADALERVGFDERLGEHAIFREQAVRQTSTLLAIRHAYTLLRGRCEHCPRKHEPGPAGALREAI